jgi:hypothetical protein
LVRFGESPGEPGPVGSTSTDGGLAVRDTRLVQVRFSAQPFVDGDDLKSFINRVRADPGLVNLDVIVAWAKRSGLSRLHDDLAAIRSRAGQTRLIVGIDEGGATKQGLEWARLLFDRVFVFHDRSGRTFHPKVYVASGETSARLLVGSNNATAGGVYFNYEAGLDCELSLPDDVALLVSVQTYVDRLLAESELCKEVSEEVLAELVGNPRYQVGDENVLRELSGLATPEELDTEVDVEEVSGTAESSFSIFGRSEEPKKPDPGASGRVTKAPAKRTSREKANPAKGLRGKGTGSFEDVPEALVQKRWFKQLSRSDAQHPPRAGSKVTGALRMSKANHPIDWRTYFRREFFSGLKWDSELSRNHMSVEYARVPFYVLIDGQAIGEYECRIDHAPHREQDQSNVPTDLKWGPLMPVIRATDYTGDYVIIERLNDGSYRLEITPNDPGQGAFLA